MDQLLDFLFFLTFRLWFWLGVGLGLIGAWVAWTYMPDTADRASAAAWIFGAGCVLGGVLATVAEKKDNKA